MKDKDNKKSEKVKELSIEEVKELMKDLKEGEVLSIQMGESYGREERNTNG